MMSADGTKFYNPLYKPDWSLEMLYSANYITHFDVIRKSLMIEVGGFDSSTDGAQDWDMFLKIGEVARQVCHIPKVLYHWRMIETSAASGIEAKPYALDAQIRSINNHFKRVGLSAKADFLDRKLYVIKVDYDIPDKYKAVIVITDKGNGSTHEIVEQVYRSNYERLDTKIVILSSESIKIKYPNITIYDITGKRYDEIILDIMSQYENNCMVFINSNVSIDKNTIFELVQWTVNDNIAMVGPKFVTENNVIHNIGLKINKSNVKYVRNGVMNPTYDEWGYTEWYNTYDLIHGSCFAIESTTLLRILENIDAASDINYQDISNVIKKLGKRNLYNPFAKVICKESDL